MALSRRKRRGGDQAWQATSDYALKDASAVAQCSAQNGQDGAGAF
jgi:hypothetical protein